MTSAVRVCLCVAVLACGCVAGAPARLGQSEAARSTPPPPSEEQSAARLLLPSAQAGADDLGAPAPGAVWVAGYWHWNGVRHVWVAGHWEKARPSFARR